MVDLHMHSIYSDGEHTPLELLDFCNEKNIDTISITDHNCILGVKEALKINPYENITIIPGIELSAKAPAGVHKHILGYNFDMENKELCEVLSAIKEDEINKVKAIISLMKTEYNVTFKEEDVENIFNLPGNIGKVDVAKLCLKNGYVSSVHEAFKVYLEKLEDKLPKRNAIIEDFECVRYIVKAGGIACIAHPVELKMEECNLENYLRMLMPYGLTAIEVYHSSHTYDYMEMLKKLSSKLGLLESVGSDYHGKVVSPKREIGTGNNGNLGLNYVSILDKLKR